MLLIVTRRAKTTGLVRESEESRSPSGSNGNRPVDASRFTETVGGNRNRGLADFGLLNGNNFLFCVSDYLFDRAFTHVINVTIR